MNQSAATTGTKSAVAERKRVASFVAITLLAVGFLSGCGGGWQGDHDVHQDQIRPGAEGSGLTGPDDSTSRF